MEFRNIRDYTYIQLYFPKVVVIDKPGIIINKTVSKFGKEGIRTRVIYHFEDLSVNLYLDTVKKIGKEKAGDLWYRIGKDCGKSYFLFMKKIDISEKLLPLVIKHIFNTLSSSGVTFGESVYYSFMEKSFLATGKNCATCRRVGNGSIVAGITSGILSSLLNENIEAEPKCENCPNNCKIIANPNIKEKYIPNIEELKPIENYGKLNFPDDIDSFESSKFKSFSDLFKFKKVWMDEKYNLFCFQGKIIVPSEIGLTETILYNYSKIGRINLAKESIIKTSENIAADILKGKQNIKDKIGYINIILAAFGWGLPYHKKIGNKVVYEFKYPPITKYKPLFRAFVLNGYLNNLYNQEFKINKITNTRIEFLS